MKKKITAVFALLMAFSMTSGIYAKAGIKGDVNNDGALTVKDLTRISKYLLGTKELEAEEFSAADLNGDGRLDIIDFILEKELLLAESGGGEYIVGVPEFSVESGFYDNEISLALTAGTESTIYYTTDGTEPTTASEVYSGEIKIKDRTSEPNKYAAITDVSLDNFNVPNVTKGTVVKAFAVDKDGNKSETVSHSYFVGINIDQQYGGMPVLSIIADPDDLFDYEKGIYVTGKVYDDWKASGDNSFGFGQTYFYPCNYNQRGQEWERKVDIELFENDGALAYSQPIGVRVTGNATRASVVKSLKFYSRDEYGKKNVKYELIPDAKTEIDDVTVRDKYKRFTMRNGGNDLGHAQFRDNYIQSLLGDRAFETQSSRPAVMFINGEYWGVYTLQEDYSDSYIENNYNIDKDNVVIIECGSTVDEGNEEDIALYEELINFAKDNDLSVASNYDRIDQMMDMQSFIDYQCAEIFIANQDWMNNNNNYRVWRARTVSDQPYEDGKWRWMLYDTEFSLSLYKGSMGGTYSEDSLKIAMYGKTSSFGFGDWGGFFPGMGGDWGGPGQQQPGQQEQLEPEEHTMLFYKLLQNDGFKQRFVTTFSDLMNKNLSQDNMLSELDRFVEMYEPVIQEHMARVSNSNNFNTEVNDIKTFIQNREKNIYSFFKTDLELSGETAQLNLAVNDSNAGTIQVNTITTTGDQWSGTYCTDYPVTLTAVPAEGYTFTGWSGGISGNDATITVTPGQAETITAQFAKK